MEGIEDQQEEEEQKELIEDYKKYLAKRLMQNMQIEQKAEDKAGMV